MRRTISVRTLWSIVAVLWMVICVWLHFTLGDLLVGVAICLAFAHFGFLADGWRVRR